MQHQTGNQPEQVGAGAGRKRWGVASGRRVVVARHEAAAGGLDHDRCAADRQAQRDQRRHEAGRQAGVAACAIDCQQSDAECDRQADDGCPDRKT